MHEDKIAKTAGFFEHRSKINVVKEKEDSIACKPNTLKTTLKPTPLEASALELMRVNQELIEELRIREAARTSPVPPIGSTVSWLSGTDEGSRAGGVKRQDAQGDPSKPKPRAIPLYGTSSGQNGISTLIAKRPSSAISTVQSPHEWVEIEITVDSGACETVMPPGLCTGISISQSSCSHGAEYEVANGETIPNLGERRCHMMTLGSTMAKKIVFQVADVHKPLLSISRCADMGFRCHLGKEGGFMEDTVTGEHIPLHRRDNLYVMKAWVRSDPSPSVPPNSNLPFAGRV